MSSAESLARAEEKSSREVEAPRGTRVTDDPAGRGSPGGPGGTAALAAAAAPPAGRARGQLTVRKSQRRRT